MNKKQIILIGFISLFLAGCASNKEPEMAFDSELYLGAPIDSLTNEEPPKSEMEAIARGDTALSLRKYDLALFEYIRSLSFPEAEYQDKSLYNIGRIHQSRGNLALAEKAYLRAIEVNPEHIQSLEQLGVIYSKAGRTVDGSRLFLQAVNADQKRLNKNTQLENFELLKEDEIASLSVDKSSPLDSYMGLGILSDVAARYDVAKRFYEKALEINSRSVKTMVNLGYSHYMTGNYHIAKRLMTTALQFDPNNEKAVNNLALIHLALGENARALNVFMRQMEEPEALNNVGYFLILQGKPDAAIPYLQRAIDKKPSYYKLANENLARALAQIRADKQQTQVTNSVSSASATAETEADTDADKVEIIKP
ncbi:tetratricopeptide repeat protein [Vibrio sp. JC009]|uniref:tetratricopeptide repeat protein n=1 Tax=Vibrio sp. JC009 TaxID=2912314 RepID=UPI0023B1475E|nr:tetratricopeptide repeat protein [Vibrio sp. JC009]WED21270.1 tetratricopeptide repeat protein [Vibrio sp. JC009]